MIIEYEYSSDADRNRLLEEHANLKLISERILSTGNYLTFTDEQDTQVSTAYINISGKTLEDAVSDATLKYATADEKYKALDLTVADLQKVKDSKMAQLEEKCNNAISSGFDATINDISYKFSCSTEAQLNFTGTQYKFDKGQITDIDWTALNNSTMKIERINLDSNSFQIVADKVLPHINANISKLRDSLQPQVESATSNQEVDSINW